MFNKNYLWIVASFAILSVLVFPFGSCSPNNTSTEGSTVDTDEDTTRRRSSSGNSGSRRSGDDDEDEPEGCDDDDGESCKEIEDCMNDCTYIYKNHPIARRSCQNRGYKTVGRLVTIHDRLMGKNAGEERFRERDQNDVKSDLNDITDDEDGIGHNELKCYLQIGAGKYIDKLEDGLTDTNLSNDTLKGSAVDRLHETLKWMVEDKETAEILNDLNRGPSILKALLEKLANLRNDQFTTDRTGNFKWQCLGENFKNYKPNRSGSGYFAETNRVNNIYNKRNNQDLDQALWWLDNDSLKIWHYDRTSTPKGQDGTIQLTDSDLFNALSCFHLIDNESNNIFTFSANEGNKDMFDMAFYLLNEKSCKDVKDIKKPGCARALICWSSWQKKCYATNDEGNNGGTECDESEDHNLDRNNTERLWDMIKNKYKEKLENEGPSKYDNCTTKGFYDFFE